MSRLPERKHATWALTAWSVLMLASGWAHAQSLTPLQAWEKARGKDPDYLAAQSDRDAILEESTQAKAQMYPVVNASYSNTRNERTMSSDASVYNYESNNRSLTVRQPLFRKALLVGLDRAQLRVSGAEANLKSQSFNLAVRLTGFYMDLVVAHQALSAAQSNLLFMQGQLEASQRAYASGVGTVLQVNEARAKTDLADIDVRTAKVQIEVAREALATVIGESDPGVMRLDLTVLSSLNWTLPPLKVWTDQAMQESPLIQSVAAQVEVASQDIEKSRAGHYPTLDAVYQVTHSAGESVTSPTFSYKNNSLGVQLNIPLFSGGYVESTVRQAQAGLEKARFNKQSTERQVIVQMSKDYKQVNDGLQRIEALSRSYKDLEQAETAARLSLQAGVGTRVQWLEVQARLAKTLQDLAEAYKPLAVSYVTLHALTGRLDDETMNRVAAPLKPVPAP